ncbi:hypothetical protein QMO14_31040 [Variovorax sp. CAN2819]|uniref:hypothetical protein n=1 Tax=Variovorax sp. CAN15 TaxID=3046727 RepID=UPI00264869F0|nr:hypothetical protein [Variovorax sp. CAN15]MDN6888019.1 hypothetical protein [Variovorax sp. CAN15]
MKTIRVLGACVAVGGVALLTGCVGVPADPYYGGGYSSGPYSGPYYSEPAPVVVPAPVYINGGGYYERRPRYYDRPGYPAVRPGYPAVRRGYPAVRPVAPPAWSGNRPGVIPSRPGQGGIPGITPTQPQQMPRGNARLWTSPDSKTQTPP